LPSPLPQCELGRSPPSSPRPISRACLLLSGLWAVDGGGGAPRGAERSAWTGSGGVQPYAKRLRRATACDPHREGGSSGAAICGNRCGALRIIRLRLLQELQVRIWALHSAMHACDMCVHACNFVLASMHAHASFPPPAVTWISPFVASKRPACSNTGRSQPCGGRATFLARCRRW
jgi:hypothetical protein